MKSDFFELRGYFFSSVDLRKSGSTIKCKEANVKKLKLQVQMSVDGYVAGPNGELDWMTWHWDDKLKAYVNQLHARVDCILLGRKMTDGFVNHWEKVKTQPEDPNYEFAKKMCDTPKVVFTRTIDKSTWNNTVLAKGDLAEEVNKLKSQKGGDIIVYGGSNFVSNLIPARLIDEFHLFINPVAIGNGLTIFDSLERKQELRLKKATGFDCGITILHYELKEL
jgi:dihydrofolate reductase